MIEREMCDLSHHSQHVLDVGKLMCLARIPVLGGDSFEMNSSFLFRLSQLRRPLAVDLKMEVFAFYCPYRFTYSNWVDYIEAGGKEAITFPTITAMPQFWLMVEGSTYPLHIWQDTARIYNRYFRDPSFAELSLTTPSSDIALRKFGIRTCHMDGWGTSQSQIADINDAEYKLDTSQPSISIFDIQERITKGRNQAYRSFVSSRYQEIMTGLAGTPPHDYSDNIPELVWRESSWMSGYDVNGTAGAEFGASVGKAVGAINFNMPRRMFTEHGTLYVFALLRFPPLFQRHRQYLDDINRPFHMIVPQPDNDVPPVRLTMADVFTGGSSGDSLGYIPAYDWLRKHPSYIHDEFYNSDQGWQYCITPSTPKEATEVGVYDDMFQSLNLRHAQATCQHRITAFRPLPGRISSVMGAF